MKLSVVIPVYNTESLLERCLDSVLSQTYNNIEVIVVNDKSPGPCSDIVNHYIKKDSRVKLVNNKVNQGLFHARIAGMEHASGDAFTFLDSDDWWQKDVARRYIEGLSSGYDTVQCNFIIAQEDGYQYIHPNNRVRNETLSRDELLHRYFSQEGHKYSFHTVWNKAYKIKVWNESVDLLKKYDDHLIMGEDVIYSCTFYTKIESQKNIEYDGIFYYQSALASTHNDKNNDKKLNKNLSDIINVFKFVRSNIIEKYDSEKINKHFDKWESLYSRFWFDNINNSIEPRKLRSLFIQNLSTGFTGEDSSKKTYINDHYSYSTRANYIPVYNDLINLICSKHIKCVSFDIFDNLITRDVLQPVDIFHKVRLQAINKGLISPSVNFKKIRIDAERNARNNKIDTLNQEITIQDIYSQISLENPQIDIKKLELIQKLELSIEVNSVIPRYDVIEILKMCLHISKEVCFTSDMYLPTTTIKEILNNALKEYDIDIDKIKIFVSSEYNKSKDIGGLYDIVSENFNEYNRDEILHIGDNYNSDEVSAKFHGFASWGTKNSFDIMSGDTPFYDGSIYNIFRDWKYFFSQTTEEIDYTHIRTCLSVIKNNLFSSPYPSISEGSLVPYGSWGLGFATLGPYIHAISSWIKKTSKNKRVIFLSRDGYLAKKSYEYLFDTECEYLRISRSSIISSILAYKKPEEELVNLIDYSKFTPRKLIKTLLPTLDERTVYDDIDSNIEFEQLFSNNNDLISIFLSVKNLKPYFEIMMSQSSSFKVYLNSFNIQDDDYVFDIGYAGTASYYISSLLGKKFNCLYLHSKTDQSSIYSNKNHYFHNRVPHVSGAIREFLISEPDNKVTHYNQNKPILLEHTPNSNKTICSDIQSGAMEFVKEFNRYSCQNISIHVEQEYERASIFIENLLTHEYKDHRNELYHVIFEDEISSSENYKHLSDDWPVIYNNHSFEHLSEPDRQELDFKNEPVVWLNSLSKPRRLLYGMLFDHADLKGKLIGVLNKKRI